MALNIPMPGEPGSSLIQGLGAGGDLMHKVMLNKYYGQLHPSGDVANAMYVEQLRNQYGENDPRYINAKRAHELAMQGRESLIGYRDILNQTAGIRFTSPLGKEIAEGKGRGAQDILDRRGVGVDAGMSYNQDGTNVVATPEEIQNIANARTAEEREAYERAINKRTSDAKDRSTLLRAENLDKTRNAINIDDLTRYSGLKGTANYLYESVKASQGNASPEYLSHKQAVNAAQLMADQMRQFYGDSIQPSAMDRLRHLANPATWYKDPKIAKAQWEQLNKILDTETETYRQYGRSPIKLNKIEYKNGQFTLGKNQGLPKSADKEKPISSNEGGSYDMKSVVPQLLKINPKYTDENIRSTAKITGKSIDQVIFELFQRSAKRGQ